MNPISGIHHVCLKAAGRAAWERAVAFYTQALGCPLVRSWGEGSASGAMIDLGGCMLELFADADRPLPSGVLRHLALRTADVDAALKLVRQAGCEITMGPTDKALGPDYPIRIAFFRGPAGESVELIQER